MDSEYNYDGILNYISAWQYIPPTRIKSLSARLYMSLFQWQVSFSPELVYHRPIFKATHLGILPPTQFNFSKADRGSFLTHMLQLQ